MVHSEIDYFVRGRFPWRFSSFLFLLPKTISVPFKRQRFTVRVICDSGWKKCGKNEIIRIFSRIQSHLWFFNVRAPNADRKTYVDDCNNFKSVSTIQWFSVRCRRRRNTIIFFFARNSLIVELKLKFVVKTTYEIGVSNIFYSRKNKRPVYTLL